MSTRCTQCNQSLWTSYDEKYHWCKPLFRVWCEEQGDTEDDARDVHALTHEDAAEEWAEQSDLDSAEYSIVKGGDVTVHVRRVGEDSHKTFVVSGEAVPSYSAREEER